MVIPHWYKDMLDDFINSLDNSSDIEPLAILKQIHIWNNNIPGLGDSASGLKEKKDLLRNKSQEYQ